MRKVHLPFGWEIEEKESGKLMASGQGLFLLAVPHTALHVLLSGLLQNELARQAEPEDRVTQ